MEVKNFTETLTNIKHYLPTLSEGQALLMEEMIMQFKRPFDFKTHDTDLLTPKMLQDFGDTLRVHHCYSKQAFSKDKFEYVLERVYQMSGFNAELASTGNPGHDIVLGTQKFSLKSEASKGTQADKIHISKFMEIGKGEWGSDPKDLIGLRERFLNRLNSFDRVLTLRQLSNKKDLWLYELVEIPMDLLRLAEMGELEMMMKSKQNPKPGYCHVTDKNGNLLYQLYFDGGSERKLQVKKLLKCLCKVHATWSFKTSDVLTEEVTKKTLNTQVALF